MAKKKDTQTQPKGLVFERYFTRDGKHPFETVEWAKRTAEIKDWKTGKVTFRQEDLDFPKFWSQRATDIVASKYFRGHLGSPKREHSVKQLIGRIVNTISGWGKKDGYFASDDDAEAFNHELTHLLLYQKAAFNSPVQFNVGVKDKPQCSACFINSVDDSMDSIMSLARTEAIIFKGGSGSGVNLSNIRGSHEKLAVGGFASGPVSFMRGYDSFAGAIKSGGATRRAAKMVILDADHPDVKEYIQCKAQEEKKAQKLIEMGYDDSIDGEAYRSVQFQNANNSVSVSDDFMEAYEKDEDWNTVERTTQKVAGTYKAREMMRWIAEATW
ncbi:MAG TPA: vitamin B12-dependent ribonucleotide reductase, partial [Acidobacteriota bacterium]|nr:vitamin B12-dependent ribonucleotide reductase [Acidobacteriota bacterium]